MSSCWKALSLILVAISSFISLAGCGGTDCNDSCAATNQCGESNIKDCDAYCGQLTKVNDDSGCSDSYDKLLDCIDKQNDICAAYRDNSCRPKLDAYNDCYNKYCADHPNTCPTKS